MIDTNDIREITTGGYVLMGKNPFAARLQKRGYTTRKYTKAGEYTETFISPEEIAEAKKRNIEKIDAMEDAGWMDANPDEIRLLKIYREANL